MLHCFLCLTLLNPCKKVLLPLLFYYEKIDLKIILHTRRVGGTKTHETQDGRFFQFSVLICKAGLL